MRAKMTKDEKRPTMNDVAAIAGVSVSTVSRALNNDPRISDRTRENVFRAVKVTNYRPNAAARALAMQSSVPPAAVRNIGIVFGRYAKPNENYFLEILDGIDEILSAGRFNMIIVTTDESPDTAARTQMMLSPETVAGVICVGQLPGEISASLRERIPNIVFVDVDPALAPGLDCVTCDNEKGAFMAVSHLIRRGRRRIALLRGSTDHHFCRALENGYRKALRKHNVPEDDVLIVEEEFINLFSSGSSACRKLLAKNIPFDALFSNDKMIIGALRVLQEAEISVPAEVAVFGFDDIEIAAFVEPPLSTISVPKIEMGSIAARTMMDKVSNKTPRRKAAAVILAPKLIERRSCGRGPARNLRLGKATMLKKPRRGHIINSGKEAIHGDAKK